MKSLKTVSLICIILCFILLISGNYFLEYGNGYKSNPKYKSRIVGGGGGMSYYIPVESNNERYLQYESDNASLPHVKSFLSMQQADYQQNQYQKDNFYPKIDYYGENEADDMFDVVNPSELLNKIPSKTNNSYTIKATYYNNIGEIEKITIVAHDDNGTIARSIDLDVIHSVESPYIVTNQFILIAGLIMIIIAPITLIVAIILYIKSFTKKLQSLE